MIRRNFHIHAFLICLMVAAFLGCSKPTQPSQPFYISAAVYPVANIFADFYERLGGESVVGPCLSQGFENNGRNYQYTSAVLMVYDPGASVSMRYALAALGNGVVIREPAEPHAGGDTVDGYRIWEEVTLLYERLGGEIVGHPLTNTRYNAELRRYEQYFENMGFYRMEDDPTHRVNLLAYGARACGTYCSYGAMRDAVMASPSVSVLPDADLQAHEQTIAEAAARLGIVLTGQALTHAYHADDSSIYQIYENLVFVLHPSEPGRAEVLAISEALNIHPDPLETQTTDKFFYAVDGAWGYNIPVYFMDYLTLHGGVEASGVPITREYAVNPDVTRQCYTNLCLEFHMTAPEMLRIRPQPIGYIYRDLNYHPSKSDSQISVLSPVLLKTWEDAPLVSQYSQQVIHAAVYENNIPLNGVALCLMLTLPDGSQFTYDMPATDEKGVSSLVLPLIQAANGTLVPYQVCTTTASMPQVCEQQNFIVWETP